MGLGTILALGTGYALARGMPNRFERRYRRQVKDIGKQLARGEGGMSQTQRDQAMAAGAQQLESVTAQQQAQLARGAASGAGASGLQQQAIRNLSQGKQKATAQLSSAVQKQDLALRDAMKQQYMAGMMNLADRSNALRAQAMGEIQRQEPEIRAAAQAIGAKRRSEEGAATLEGARTY